MTNPPLWEVTRDPIPLEEVWLRFPALRQSLLAKHDDCALSALFDLRYAKGWNTHPQARGALFHRFAGECLRTMRETGSADIPVAEALEILYEVVRQKDVDWQDRVRVPLRELRQLRMAAIKFAADNRFSVDKILDIERRLYCTVTYPDEDGRPIERTLTGQPDVLIADPPNGAIVIDWKDTWALPPQRIEEPGDYEDDGANVSYEGYFQQRSYALLVLKNYPAVEYVILREFYPRKTQAREATVHRADLEHVEREFSMLIEEFDARVAVGSRDAGTLSDKDAWKPSPGKHCSFCVRPGLCPITDEAKREGAIRNSAMAKRYAGEFRIASEVRTRTMKALQTWTATHGNVEVKWSKGRREVGYRERVEHHRRRDGTVVPRVKSVFGDWPVETSDKGAHPIDEKLEQAMRESVEETRRAREAAKR